MSVEGSGDKVTIGLYAPSYASIVYLSDFNGCMAKLTDGNGNSDCYEIHGYPEESEIFLKKNGVTFYSLFGEKDRTLKVDEYGERYYGPAPLMVGQVLSLHPYPNDYPCSKLRLNFLEI